MRRSRLAAVLLAGAVVTGTAATVASTANAATDATAALSSNWYASASYLMPQSNNPPDAVAVMNATGQKAFQLAFILAPNGGGCSPTWGGTSAVGTDTAIPAAISTIRG